MFSVESEGGGEEDVQGLWWILIFGEWQSDLTSKRMVGLPGRFEGVFEVGEHEFRVLKRNVKERNLG